MHRLPYLFSFMVLLKLSLTLASTNDSALYFPGDNEGNSQVYYNSQNRVQSLQFDPTDLASLRGTSAYEKYVNEIISTGISRLTVTLNKLLTQETTGQNVVFSPFSIASALALVLLGSNGVTLKEISELVGVASGIPDLSSKSQIVHEQYSRIIQKLIATSGFTIGETVNVATAVFVQSGYPIRPLYKSTAEDLYHSSVLNVDFRGNSNSAFTQVNRWIEHNTNGKIKTILDELPSSDTKVILASALYFKAEWETHFFEGSTKRRPFFVNGINSASLHEVDMMSIGGEFPYYKDPDLGCEILGLPYKGRKSTMYIVKPFESDKNKLHKLASQLTETDLDKLVGNVKQTGVLIVFPKMTIESTINLKKSLERLGVKSLFNPNQANLALLSPGEVLDKVDPISPLSTNFTEKQQGRKVSFGARTPLQAEANPTIESRTSETLDNIRQLLNEQSADNHFQNPGLYADQVIHKVFIDITEKGTEAAAATSVSLSRDGSKQNFRVDVPFFFFIRHEETKTILFWGSVVLPTPSYGKFH